MYGTINVVELDGNYSFPLFKRNGVWLWTPPINKKNQDKMDINSGMVAQLALFTRKLGQVVEWDFI